MTKDDDIQVESVEADIDRKKRNLKVIINNKPKVEYIFNESVALKTVGEMREVGENRFRFKFEEGFETEFFCFPAEQAEQLLEALQNFVAWCQKNEAGGE